MKLLFYTACGHTHEMFLLPYILSALLHNADSGIEIVVRTGMGRECSAGLSLLREHFVGRTIKLVEVNPSWQEMNRVGYWAASRFVRHPTLKDEAEVIYIGDVDILVLEGGVYSFHMEQMRKTGLCFSNMKRAGEDKLSGLHVVKQEYYDYWVQKYSPLGNDEELLFRIVKENIADPNLVKGCLRPAHGIHLSLNRKSDNWELTEDRALAYGVLTKTAIWQAAYPHFDSRYKDRLREAERFMTEKGWCCT